MSSGDPLRPDAAANPSDQDAAIMRGISENNPKALEQLYDRYSPRVFAFCLRSLRDRSEAEDLTLEIFWELWRRQKRYDAARSSPLTYLMKVTRSRVVDRLRSLRSKAPTQQFRADWQMPVEDARPSTAIDPLDQIADVEAGAQLRDALNGLSADQRKALEMAYFDALTYSEVAEALGQPLGTVKSRIRQALSQLRQALGRVVV